MQQGKEQIDAAKQKMQETSEKMSGSIEDSIQQLEELSESAKQQIEDSKKQINDLFNLKKSTSGE
jgi:flagellar hook-associated protein FlgK